jgi:hypothetical protein
MIYILVGDCRYMLSVAPERQPRFNSSFSLAQLRLVHSSMALVIVTILALVPLVKRDGHLLYADV